MKVIKTKEGTPGVGIPEWGPLATEEGKEDQPVGPCWFTLNHPVGEGKRVGLLVLDGTWGHQVFNCPLVDVPTVVERSADHPEAIIDGVAEEPLLGVDYWVVGDNPDPRRGSNGDGDRVLLDGSNTKVGKCPIKGAVNERGLRRNAHLSNGLVCQAACLGGPVDDFR